MLLVFPNVLNWYNGHSEFGPAAVKMNVLLSDPMMILRHGMVQGREEQSYKDGAPERLSRWKSTSRRAFGRKI